jgi:hypothetical protein
MRRRARALIGAAAWAVLLGGCAGATHEGRPPPIAALAGLSPGVSTRAEISAALGPPEGHGLFAEAGAPLREVWVYEENGADHGAITRKSLLVFIDPDSGRLAGYWWYRGGVLIGRTP